MPKLKVPSLSSKPAEKAPPLLHQLQLTTSKTAQQSDPSSVCSVVKRHGPRMKSCFPPAVKAKQLTFPRRLNGLKANIAFKGAFGGSDDEVRLLGREYFCQLCVKVTRPHPFLPPCAGGKVSRFQARRCHGGIQEAGGLLWRR